MLSGRPTTRPTSHPRQPRTTSPDLPPFRVSGSTSERVLFGTDLKLEGGKECPLKRPPTYGTGEHLLLRTVTRNSGNNIKRHGCISGRVCRGEHRSTLADRATGASPAADPAPSDPHSPLRCSRPLSFCHRSSMSTLPNCGISRGTAFIRPSEERCGCTCSASSPQTRVRDLPRGRPA